MDCLGKERIERIYDYSDILHCEPIEKVAMEYVEECSITQGQFDNEADCEYEIPDDSQFQHGFGCLKKNSSTPYENFRIMD